MPVRKVVRPTGRGVRGYFPSRKMGRMVAWESLLERDAILRFEFSSGVLQYEEQPKNVYYAHNGITRHYIPDFELMLHDESIMHIEVKPLAKLRLKINAEKYSAITEHYAQSDVTFRILTEIEIRTEPSLANLKRLARHLPREATSHLDSHVENLTLLPANTIGGAAAVCGGELPVYQLLALGRYSFDFNQPLLVSTHIFPCQKEAKDAALLF